MLTGSSFWRTSTSQGCWITITGNTQRQVCRCLTTMQFIMTTSASVLDTLPKAKLCCAQITKVQQKMIADCALFLELPANHHGSQTSLMTHDSCGASQRSMEMQISSQTFSNSSQVGSGYQDGEATGQPPDFRPMTGIQEVKESSRPTTRDDSAAAQQQLPPTSWVCSTKSKCKPRAPFINRNMHSESAHHHGSLILTLAGITSF